MSRQPTVCVSAVCTERRLSQDDRATVILPLCLSAPSIIIIIIIYTAAPWLCLPACMRMRARTCARIHYECKHVHIWADKRENCVIVNYYIITEFNLIATPSPNDFGNSGLQRLGKEANGSLYIIMPHI